MKYSFLFLMLMVGLVQAADEKRERAYSEWVLQTLRMGEPIWLQASGQKFLSIYTQTEQQKSLGTAILLHDQGGFADQKPVIHMLRTQLPQHQWSTLSLQLPVLEEGAPDADYFTVEDLALARIQAAVTFLKKSNINNIVLLGYGLGASFALSHVASKPGPVKALVLISLKLPAEKIQQQAWIKKLTAIKLPVLDVYAEQDITQTRLTARKRRLAARDNPAYQQLRLTDTRHRYEGNEALLIKRVYSWMTRKFAQASSGE
jgi:pimeloyl-ACP methyl ester carboxylesterase